MNHCSAKKTALESVTAWNIGAFYADNVSGSLDRYRLADEAGFNLSVLNYLDLDALRATGTAARQPVLR